MQVDIKSCIQWAKEAEGITVVMDVFRASNTIIACMEQGAEYIIPVGALEEAVSLKEQFPDHLLFGERRWLIAEWCTYGNSPFETKDIPLKDKKVILTTSNGSQGIVNAHKAEEILIGSFANADAIVNYIKNIKPKKVSLVAIGFNWDQKATEDELCGQYIKAKLLDQNIDFKLLEAEILKCDGADRLRSLGQNDDLTFCLKLNSYNIVPFYDMDTKRIYKK